MLIFLKGFLRNSARKRMTAVMRNIPRKQVEFMFIRLMGYDLL